VGVLQSDNVTGAIFSGDPPLELDPGGAILTNDLDSALILVYTPDTEKLIARILVYGNTNVSLDEASTPRFGASRVGHKVDLSLNSGRLQLNIIDDLERDITISVNVPQGEIALQESGQYSIITSNLETQVAVLEGRAELMDGDQILELNIDQRGVLPAEEPVNGPFDTERNLIQNSDFGLGIEGWVQLSPNIEIADQPKVETTVTEFASEPALKFRRVGIGHADAGLRQIISQDVTDFESLRLLVTMRIMDQSLGVCGQQGSECPIIVRIDYEDVNGVDQTWQQGFFAVGEIGPDTPDVCVACPPPLNEHQRVPYQQIVFYESENLLEKLGQSGILPRQIKSITLISSGHTFDAEVIEVALLARE
jgi:hypothetical protein